jgi:hypothetical protein
MNGEEQMTRASLQKQRACGGAGEELKTLTPQTRGWHAGFFICLLKLMGSL